MTIWELLLTGIGWGFLGFIGLRILCYALHEMAHSITVGYMSGRYAHTRTILFKELVCNGDEETRKTEEPSSVSEAENHRTQSRE